MSQETATMAAQARGGQARADWIEACPDVDDFTPALSGWRVGLAAAVVAAVLALLALPVMAVLDPSFVGWGSQLAHLGAVVTLMAGVKALVFVVAVVVLARSDDRR